MATTHFTEADLPRLLRGSENEHLEFKRGLRDRRTSAKELASLANSGHGLLIVGVDEMRGAIGVQNLDEELRLLDEGKNSISPSLSVRVFTPEVEGRKLLVAEVDGTDPPYISPDGAIVRRSRHGATVAFSGGELRKALEQRVGVAPSESIVGLLDDLNHRLEKEERLAEEERQAARHARSWRGQWQGWVIGGAIGAVMGAAVAGLLA